MASRQSGLTGTAVFLALCSVLYFSAKPVEAAPLPFVMLVGLGDSCNMTRYTGLQKAIKTAIPGIVGYCMELGKGPIPSWTWPLSSQVAMVCSKAIADRKLANGFNLVGLGQGALIGRGYIEMCAGGPKVNHFISLAGPHAGIKSIPKCALTGNAAQKALCKSVSSVLPAEIYDPPTQSSFAPASYVVVPGDYDNFLASSSFLPAVNNAIPELRITSYKTRFAALKKLTLVKFAKDTYLVPALTAWFGYYPTNSASRVLPYTETNLYKWDWIGLKALKTAGKVFFVDAPGAHLNITALLIKNTIVPGLK